MLLNNSTINGSKLNLVLAPRLEAALRERHQDDLAIAIASDRFKEQASMYLFQQPDVFNHCTSILLVKHLR